MLTQPESHTTVQQLGSMLQTPAQQTSSLQPADALRASKQLPSHGQRQFDSGWQRVRASDAHAELQFCSQQIGSAEQTMVQQVASRQPGFGCAESQAPWPGQVAKPTHTAFALSTQASFQPKLQQIGSIEHTASQQAWSAQPGVPWTSSGEPVPGQFEKLMSQVIDAPTAQVSSHAREQQVGSSAQIVAQQVSSSQPGTKLGTEQGRDRGSPQPIALSRQSVPAFRTQKMSHSTEQQVGSTRQTLSQQTLSRHDGVPCGKKQLPASTFPQPLQSVSARVAQSASHSTSQQVGSLVQTVAQHAASEQPGPACFTKQLPVADEQMRLIAGSGASAQFETASWTQVRSQLTLQQNASTAQTVSQQMKSLHPPVMWTLRHERFWPGIGPLKPQRHFGRLQRLPGAVARSAHTVSQRVEQQKGSKAHTASQHARSSQYGPSCW